MARTEQGYLLEDGSHLPRLSLIARYLCQPLIRHPFFLVSLFFSRRSPFCVREMCLELLMVLLELFYLCLESSRYQSTSSRA